VIEAIVNMRCFSYVVRRDFGFAPNPYGNVCSLATCKPDIRNAAQVGDWIFGTGSVENVGADKLIYAMQIEEIILFNDYFSDLRFTHKKPNMLSGSTVQMYGDNIYSLKNGIWLQSDSHHSLVGGFLNKANLTKDTKSSNVLISWNYYYFGQNALSIPKNLIKHVVKKGPGHRCISDHEVFNELINYVIAKASRKGMNGFPCKFKSKFVRYSGD
jgi:protoporphyrinogen oxidase